MKEKAQYYYIEDVENLERYAPGGYHPVTPGEILHGRYSIIDKLGHGGYSTVWLARDAIGGRYVALKIAVASCGTPSREVKVLKDLSSPAGSAFPTILDEFEVQGPNGTHYVYVTPPARCDLRSGSEVGMFCLEIARALCGRLIAAVATLHSKGFVHGDLRLSNVLLMPSPGFFELSVDQFYEEYSMPEPIPISRIDGQSLAPQVPKAAFQAVDLSMSAGEFEFCDTDILLADFGESFSPSTGESRLGQDSHTPDNVRPPECYFDPATPMSAAADIWQLGLALWGIVAKEPLTPTDYRSPTPILKKLIDMLGPLPPSWRDAWGELCSMHLEETGRRLDTSRVIWASLEDAYEKCMEASKILEVVTMDEAEREAFLDLIRRMLAYLPEERPSAQEILQSDWVVKWVTPDLERSIRETVERGVDPAKTSRDIPVTVMTTTELHESDDSGISLSLDPPMTETSDPHDDSGVAV